MVIGSAMLKNTLRPSNLNPSLHWVLVSQSHPRFCCDQDLDSSYITLPQQASQGMVGPVPKGTFAPVGPVSHSPVVQAPMVPCLARLPVSPALLAITALRTLPATVDTHVLQVSTAQEVSAWDIASPARLPAGGSKGSLGSVHSTVLSGPLPCGQGALRNQEILFLNPISRYQACCPVPLPPGLLQPRPTDSQPGQLPPLPTRPLLWSRESDKAIRAL